MESLKNKIRKGLVWTFTERLLVEGVHVVLTIVLARLLMPADFGLVAMLGIVTGVATICMDCGFANALIQRKNLTQEDRSTAFATNVAIAIACYAAIFLAAPCIADFYDKPVLAPIARAIGLALPINAIAIMPTSELTRELRFRAQTLASVASFTSAGAVAAIIAWRGGGPWALVAQALVAAAVRTSIILAAVGGVKFHRPSAKSFRELFAFGSNLLAAGIVNTIYENLYNVFIGKRLSPADVGLFNRGLQIPSLPADITTNSLLKVAYPVYSRFAEDPQQLRRACLKSAVFAALLLAPALAVFCAFAPQIVAILFGEQWMPAVPLMRILSIGAFCHPFSQIALHVLYAKGRTDVAFKIEFPKKAIGLALLFAALPFGLVPLAVAKTATETVFLVIDGTAAVCARTKSSTAPTTAPAEST